MNQKKVLHLLASNQYSGAENVVCTIIENTKDKFEMVYCSPLGPIEKTLKEKQIKYYGLNKFNVKELKKVINEFKPDVIHAHDYRASILAAFSGFNGKIISHLHNNCPFAKKWNLKTILYSICTKKYYKVVGVSEKVYEEAIFKNKIKKKYKTIYNFINAKTILEKANEYNYDKEYDLFFIGRLTEQKDPYCFIEIVKELKKQKPDITAAMIGDGELKNDCIKLIEQYNLQNTITMLGFVNNPFPIIKKCKIGVMPSKWEGLGLTAIESAVLEKPVLNSGVGGLEEIFFDNSEFICSDSNDYVVKIMKILDSKKNNTIDKYNSIYDKFCNKEIWKERITKIYK